MTGSLGLLSHNQLAELAAKAAAEAADAKAVGDHDKALVLDAFALSAEQALITKIAQTPAA